MRDGLAWRRGCAGRRRGFGHRAHCSGSRGTRFGLAAFRHRTDSLTRAAFLSARNDALANVAIIVAGLVTLFWRSGWSDLIVGVGIAILNVDAARAGWRAARDEQATAASATP